MENVTIEKWKLDKIKETLRIVSFNYSCENRETAMDRMVCKSKLYINEALENVETRTSSLNLQNVIKRGFINRFSDKWFWIGWAFGMTVSFFLAMFS